MCSVECFCVVSTRQGSKGGLRVGGVGGRGLLPRGVSVPDRWAYEPGWGGLGLIIRIVLANETTKSITPHHRAIFFFTMLTRV